MQNNHTKYNNMGSRKWILAWALFFFTFVLLPLEAQEKLKVEGDLIIKSADSGPPRFGLIARPFIATPEQPEPPSPQAGEIYYEDSMDKFRWYDGAGWSNLCSGEEYVATHIVSAYNSIGATRDGTNPCLGDGSTCNNPKADWTCDGLHDQEEINDAIYYGPADKGAVYLLEGTYNITADIVLSSNVSLIGTGKGTVLKVADDSAEALKRVIICSGTGALISQLTIDGDRDNRSNAIPGIELSYAEYCKIDKVWVERMRGHGIYFAPSSPPSRYNIILNSNIRQNNHSGIEIEEGDYNIISNNNVENNCNSSLYAGIFLRGAEGNIVSYNNARNNGAGAGIEARLWSRNNIILGNNVQGHDCSAGIVIFPAAYPASNDEHHNIVCANNVQGNFYGISVASTLNIISGNIVFESGGGIGTSGHGNVISSNRIFSSTGASYGINIDVINNSQDSDTYILGNLIDGAGYICSGYDRRIHNPVGEWYERWGLIANTKYMDKAKISLERVVVGYPTLIAGSTLDVSVSPKAYVALNPISAITLSTTTAISDGKTAGDMLILEGRSNSYTVTVLHNANTILNGAAARILGEDDILSLIWNGSDWVEIGWVNN